MRRLTGGGRYLCTARGIEGPPSHHHLAVSSSFSTKGLLYAQRVKAEPTLRSCCAFGAADLCGVTLGGREEEREGAGVFSSSLTRARVLLAPSRC